MFPNVHLYTLEFKDKKALTDYLSEWIGLHILKIVFYGTNSFDLAFKEQIFWIIRSAHTLIQGDFRKRNRLTKNVSNVNLKISNIENELLKYTNNWLKGGMPKLMLWEK